MDIATRVMEFNRIKSFVSRYVLGHYWVSELWRLHHIGEINSYQKEAGDDWSRIVFKYRKYNTLGNEVSDERAQIATKDFNSALLALGDANVVNAVNDLCVEDRHLEPSRLALARRGLDDLASHLYGSQSIKRVCECCGSRLKNGGRGPSPRFCSNRCRMASMRKMAKTPHKT